MKHRHKKVYQANKIEIKFDSDLSKSEMCIIELCTQFKYLG